MINTLSQHCQFFKKRRPYTVSSATNNTNNTIIIPFKVNTPTPPPYL